MISGLGRERGLLWGFGNSEGWDRGGVVWRDAKYAKAKNIHGMVERRIGVVVVV